MKNYVLIKLPNTINWYSEGKTMNFIKKLLRFKRSIEHDDFSHIKEAFDFLNSDEYKMAKISQKRNDILDKLGI